MLRNLAAFCGILVVAGSSPAFADGIRGDYVEARTNDVFTGPCFSNAEVFITGHQAVLAWKIDQGSYKGVDLSGLTVAAAIRGSSTFTEDDPASARSIILVDHVATDAQRDALVALLKEMVGDRLRNVVDVRRTKMILTVEAHHASESDSITDTAKAKDRAHSGHGMPKAPRALFWAPGLAEIDTRPLNENDHFCGNEVVAYAPLAKGTDVLPAYTIVNSFQGKGLDTTWKAPFARSSFVGRFTF
ncbi:MAG: DUF1326 domain-containing protein [Isosphaeraceae bacterium]|nr:DUF1326 domain-containing protein [Isosphaeraceae bacterium]